MSRISKWVHPWRLAAVWLLAGAPAHAEPIAMALAVKGQVTLQPRSGATKRAAAMDMLQAGDRLAVPADGEVAVIFFGDRHRERVKPGTRVTVGKAGCAPPGAVAREAPVTSRAAANVKSVRALARSGVAGGSVFRDPRLPAAPPAVRPMYGATVLSERPPLSWAPVPRATGYEVTLTTGGGERVWKRSTPEPNLPYPEDERPLVRGRLYHWRVTATVDGQERPAAESKLAVATESEMAELRDLPPADEEAAPADLLLLTAAYQAHGCYEEALALYERLARTAAEEPGFQAALADYYQRAGRPEAAAAALERARQLGFTP